MPPKKGLKTIDLVPFPPFQDENSEPREAVWFVQVTHLVGEEVDPYLSSVASYLVVFLLNQATSLDSYFLRLKKKRNLSHAHLVTFRELNTHSCS